MARNKDYTLTNQGEHRVLIKKAHGQSRHYPYDFTFLEVDADFDHETLKIKSFRGKEDWSYRLLRHETDPLANWQSRERAIEYVGEDAIVDAENQVRKNIRKIKAMVNKAKKTALWKDMWKVAKQYVKHYKVDVTYSDALFLALYPHKPFIWFVRECGTDIVTENDAWARAIMKNSSILKYYYYDGNTETVFEVTRAEVEDMLSNMRYVEGK